MLKADLEDLVSLLERSLLVRVGGSLAFTSPAIAALGCSVVFFLLNSI